MCVVGEGVWVGGSSSQQLGGGGGGGLCIAKHIIGGVIGDNIVQVTVESSNAEPIPCYNYSSSSCMR